MLIPHGHWERGRLENLPVYSVPALGINLARQGYVAFAYDMAVIAIPAAFLVSDQIRCGLLKGEQTVMVGLFAALIIGLVALRDPPGGVTFGGIPIGPIVVVTVLGLTLRRALRHGGSQPSLRDFPTQAAAEALCPRPDCPLPATSRSQ